MLIGPCIDVGISQKPATAGKHATVRWRRAFVAVTRVWPTPTPELVSEFSSRDDLVSVFSPVVGTARIMLVSFRLQLGLLGEEHVVCRHLVALRCS